MLTLYPPTHPSCGPRLNRAQFRLDFIRELKPLSTNHYLLTMWSPQRDLCASPEYHFWFLLSFMLLLMEPKVTERVASSYGSPGSKAAYV